MAKELAFTLINPYTISKSRTGGVIARFMSRTGLELVGTRMFGPSTELVDRYAKLAASEGFYPRRMGPLVADYLRAHYAPDPRTGRPRRVMLMLFEGESAVRKTRAVAGNLLSAWRGGDTVRGTFGDYIVNDRNEVSYFEPAVLVGPDVEKTAKVLRLWAKHSNSDGGILTEADDVPREKGVQSTLVMLKPDNFQSPNLRAGHIVDVLSRSGLRIIAIKKFSMTVAQAERFYGPVRPMLHDKVGGAVGEQAREILQRELGFEIPDKNAVAITAALGKLAGEFQFENIVQFMTGYRPSECKNSEKSTLGREQSIALVYRGRDAVRVIREILGPTDPAKAPAGSVRREFGSNIMVNAAHASDSPRNATREMRILNVAEDSIRPWVRRYYGA